MLLDETDEMGEFVFRCCVGYDFQVDLISLSAQILLGLTKKGMTKSHEMV